MDNGNVLGKLLGPCVEVTRSQILVVCYYTIPPGVTSFLLRKLVPNCSPEGKIQMSVHLKIYKHYGNRVNILLVRLTEK